MVHEGKWQLVRADDGRMLAIPPTVTFGMKPDRDPPEAAEADAADAGAMENDADYDSSS